MKKIFKKYILKNKITYLLSVMSFIAGLTLFSGNLYEYSFSPFGVPVGGGIKDISVGYSHWLVLTNGGSVWAGGENLYGQVGVGTFSDNEDPVKIFDGGCDKVFAGLIDSFVLKSNGEVWAFGSNEYGQLGTGDDRIVSVPVKIFDSGIKKIAPGLFHTLFLKDDGSLLTCGKNGYGELCLDNHKKNNYRINKVFDSGIKDIAAGRAFSLVLKDDGTLLGAGVNTAGQLGLEPRENKRVLLRVIDTGVAKIGAGLEHTVYIKSDGKVYTLGRNIEGQYGNGTFAQVGDVNTYTPVLTSNSGIKDILPGQDGTFFIKDNGTLAGCGRNIENQLLIHNQRLVFQVTDLKNSVAKACIGDGFSLVLDDSGSLTVYGTQSPVVFTQSIPDESAIAEREHISSVKKILDSGVKAVRAEKRHRLIVMEDGSLWGYGSNFHGELGQSSAEYFYNPVKIMNANVADVEPGLDYTLILMDNGDVYACGKNSDGQLGTGDLQDKFSPVKVFSDAISVSAGCNHSIFLKSDLSLWACGTNNYGQFGDGGKADVPQTSIVKIVDSNVGSAAAGYYYTVYSSATPGYLYAAGNNIVGQLGHGRIGGDYFTFEFSPSQDIKKVFAFGMTTFMIDKNDALFGYGNNCSGLINPSLLYHDMERYKIEIFKSGVEDVASSYTNTVVLMKDSSVMVSGSNFNGQLSRPGQFLVNETFTKMADGGVKSIAACDNAVLLSFNQYEITFQSGQHGHLDGELTQKVNAGGDSTSVTAIADDGYFFTGWTGDITTSDNPIIVKNVQKDLQLNASFEPVADAVLLTLTPSDKGVLSPSEGSFNVKINTPQHITAQPADGYSFNKWTIVSGNVAFDDSNAADTNITLSSDAVVTAEFTPDGNNRAPVAKEDFYVVDLNNTVTISSSNGVLANDADPDGDTMAAILQKLPDFGTVTLNSDGSFTYDPVSYQCPLDSFTYMASDGTLVSKPVTVHLKYKKNIIVNVNDDSFSTSKNTPLNISAPGILGNDSVTFMIPITAEVAELPKHGTLQLNDDGSFSYTPDTDYTGQDYFKYKADTGNVSAVGTVLLNVLEDAHGEIIQNGLVLWLDGNDIDGDGVAEGLSEDGVESNGDITVWKDKSSQHNDAISDNNNIKPQLEINSFNGKPVVKYSRLSDRSSSVSKFQEIQDIRTVFWVIFENDQTFTFLSGDFHRGTSELWNIYSGNQNVFDGDSKVFNNTLWGRNDNLPPKKWIIFTHRTVGPAKGDTIVRDNNDYNYDRTILFAETLVYNRVLTDEECITVQNALYNKWFKSPTAVDDSYQVNKNQALTSIQVEGVSANDFLPQEFPEYCIIVTQQPAHGILQMYDNGSFIYTPDSDYTGSDSFKYYIENKWYKTNEATVSMTVTDKQLYSLTVNNGKGDGIFEEGSRIMIAADENNSADKIFSHWSGDSDKLSDPYIPNTFVTMPAENITVTAEYKSVVTSNILYSISGVVSGDEIDGVTITVQNSDGDEIARTATSAGGAYKFENLPPGTYTVKPESASAAFSPTERQAVLVCSNLIGVNFESSVQKYNLTVTNGTGTGTYTPGAQVPITADTPASGMVFDRWNVTAGGDASIVDNQYSASAIITMPKNDVTVEALYKNSTPGDDPTSIAGCVLWLDGADPNGDGSTVSGALDTWKDKSGNGNDAVQNDSAKQPSVVSAELNGKSVVTFDGTDDSFSFSEIADVKTVFWILKEENQTSDGSNLHFLLGDSSKYDFHRGSGTLWDSTYVADGIKNGVTRVDRADFDGLNTDIPADKYVMVTLLASEDLTASQITKDRDIGRSWDGGIAEIIIYNQALSDTDRDSVETYLYNKWFGTAPVTYSITGTVSGDIQQGVTVAVDATHSAVTDASGNYTISGLADGTYTVIPTLAGYTFTPATASATVAGADVTGVNFSSAQNAAPQFTLTVNNGTGSGQYAENDSVTISAAVPAGQVFDAWTGDTQYLADASIVSTTVTMPAQNITVTATFKQPPPNTHSISGTVTGVIQQGVTVAVDATHSAVTDASGNYTISGLADGTYTVTPTLAGYTFTPATATAAIAGDDISGVDFSASEEISENSLPVSIEDSYNMIDGTPLNVEEASGVLANDIDMDGDELTAVLVKAPQNGTLNLNADGSFTFNNDSFVGVVTFSYLANDATDDGNTVSVTINILPAGSDIPPSAVGDKYECAQDSTLSVPVETGVLVNDINASGASVSLLVQANHGTITLNQDGSFTFTPEKGFSGIDSFEYALDNITPQVSAKVSIIVMPVNITLGTILTFNSNEIVGLNGKTLLKPPKLYGLFPNNKKGGFKKIKASTTETFSGAWGKKYALYDKKALKTGYKSYFDSNGALSNQPVKVFMKGKTTDKAKIDTEIKTVYLVPPVFTAFTNAKGEAITSISAGKPITVVGKYFGDKLPKVFLELPDGKKLKCKIDKAALKYTNFKGKQSPMDPLSGESLIIITVPAGKVTPGTYPLIIDNKIGIATTPHVDDNNRGSLPLLTIE